MKSKKVFLTLAFLIIALFSIQANAQALAETQEQNARATGYAIVAARNPGKSFPIHMIKWDGTNTLENNANTQINPYWHAQAVVKGNYFDQGFAGSDFTHYSSVLLSQAEFDIYKNLQGDWWIVCSTLPSFSNSSVTIANNGNVGIGTSNPSAKHTIGEGGQVLNFITNNKLTGTWPPVLENTTMTIQSSGNSAGNLAFATGNSESMRIIANCNVGIGTTDPKSKLHVFSQENGVFNGLVIDNRKNYGVGSGINQTSRILLSLSENGAPNPYNYTQTEKVALLNNVQWGGNETLSKPHFNEIIFQYAARDSKEVAYTNGLAFAQQNILNNVVVNTNGSLFKKYAIAYKKDLNNTQYQYVDKITEYNSQNQAANPVVFNYQNSSNSIWKPNFLSDNDNDRFVGDFDGDGKIDYLKFHDT